VTYRCGIGPGIPGLEPGEPQVRCDAPGCTAVVIARTRTGAPPAWLLDRRAPPRWRTIAHTDHTRTDFCPEHSGRLGMRALTLIQPMAWAIVRASKRIENRPMNLPVAMRGTQTCVAVHAGKGWSDAYAETCVRATGLSELPSESRDVGLVGAMILSGRVFTDAAPPADPWYGGPFGYEVAWACYFTTPIPCRGMLGFWPLPVDAHACVSALLAPLLGEPSA
jgi:hypothetical protein